MRIQVEGGPRNGEGIFAVRVRGFVECDAPFELLLADIAPWTYVIGHDIDLEILAHVAQERRQVGGV